MDKNIYLFNLLKINDRRTRWPVTLSEARIKYTKIHKYTQCEKVQKRKKQANKNIKHIKHNARRHIVQTEKKHKLV